MLSYQHVFHAGNHADILKHSVLIQVLESLNKKDKPYTFFDTHSGSALYDLTDSRSLKTGEAEKGVIQFSKSEKDSLKDYPPLLHYYDFVSAYLKNHLYPGSPEIEACFMRKQDTLILSELHPSEIENLRENMKNHKGENKPSVKIHFRDGWEMLKALTPPSTGRGAVLIDPSYETSDDYLKVAEIICAVNKKWSNGIILLWYPLLAYRKNEIKCMLETIENNVLKTNHNTQISNLVLKVNKEDAHKEVALEKNEEVNDSPRLYGSGMFIINTPYMLEENVRKPLDFLANVFSKKNQ
ncbi:MAG: 23S rRNA (adenine(2030)-N(6))-methyltransferase RlmJ [Treponema sp.]|nr:23S rRNA (adenine(2030)-N(6))-methyltransferase RlmJ [Treponema sp.]